MKNIFTILVSLVFVVGLAGMTYGAQMSLAGAWSFDDGSGKTARDSVAGNNGELMGSTKFVAGGNIGGAVQFPGKGDSYVIIPHKDYMDADAYTFTVWTKLDAASWQYIAWKTGQKQGFNALKTGRFSQIKPNRPRIPHRPKKPFKRPGNA